jgi:predicted RNA-binding protein YlxR (DUF448 family)
MEYGAKGPIRTCCGCGQREVKGRLVRVTTVDGTLVLDLAGRRGGRGAYLHPHRACWKSFVQGKSYVQSLRRRVLPAERELLSAMLRATLDQEQSAPSHGG